MASDNEDAHLRQAGFDHVNRLAALKGGILDSVYLSDGFEFEGDRVPLGGMTIRARLIARSTRVMMSSTTNSWEPT
jgi:hypothetical protein